jgi:hypothetical protein
MWTVCARVLCLHNGLSLKVGKPYRANPASLAFDRINDAGCRNLICKGLPRRTTNVQKLMIAIRSSKVGSEVALSCLEVTLTTPRSVYTISSNSPMIDSESPFCDGLFGAISWPRSCFRVPEGLLIDQQMFLPHDGSAVALSWALHGDTAITAQLVVRPFFSGCGPRSYRDVGFHFESEANGGRLTWLPNVRGPKVVADSNGRYRDDPVRSLDCFCEQAAAASASEQDLSTPGSFEFELSARPSVLIFSFEGPTNTQRNRDVGAFLAGLMQDNSPAKAGSRTAESAATRTHHVAVA